MTEKNLSMRSELARVRYLGSARQGARNDWRMRITSVALFLLAFGFVWLFLSLFHRDYKGVLTLFGDSVLPGAIALTFVLVSCYHMRIGMQSIIDDYAHDHRIKQWALIGNILICGAIAVTTGLAILKLSMG